MRSIVGACRRFQPMHTAGSEFTRPVVCLHTVKLATQAVGSRRPRGQQWLESLHMVLSSSPCAVDHCLPLVVVDAAEGCREVVVVLAYDGLATSAARGTRSRTYCVILLLSLLDLDERGARRRRFRIGDQWWPVSVLAFAPTSTAVDLRGDGHGAPTTPGDRRHAP